MPEGFPFVEFVLPRDVAKFSQVFLSGGWWLEGYVLPGMVGREKASPSYGRLRSGS